MFLMLCQSGKISTNLVTLLTQSDLTLKAGFFSASNGRARRRPREGSACRLCPDQHNSRVRGVGPAGQEV